MLLEHIFCKMQYMFVSFCQAGYKHMFPCTYEVLYYKIVLILKKVFVIFWEFAARKTLVPAQLHVTQDLAYTIISSNKTVLAQYLPQPSSEWLQGTPLVQMYNNFEKRYETVHAMN